MRDNKYLKRSKKGKERKKKAGRGEGK